MINVLNTTGKRIRVHREDLGLSQKDVVEKLMEFGIEIRQSRLSRIENQDYPPSGEILRGLSTILGVSTDYLLLLTENPLPTDDTVEPKASMDDDPLFQKLLQYWVLLSPTDQAIVLNLAARLSDQNVVAIVRSEKKQ